MRLGSETLVDLTVRSEGDAPPPAPETPAEVETDGGRVEVPVWAVPRVPRAEEDEAWNLQFRAEDLGGMTPVVGGEVTW
jgi:hypothetical protein